MFSSQGCEQEGNRLGCDIFSSDPILRHEISDAPQPLLVVLADVMRVDVAITNHMKIHFSSLN
ncbi:MAG: hypothetical protein ACR2NI_07000 [Pirellulales bacterium]